MSLLMAALRKAEAAKRSGKAAPPESSRTPDSFPFTLEASEPAQESVAPPAPQFTTYQDLLELAPSADDAFDPQADDTGAPRDELHDYLSNNQPVEAEAPPQRPDRDRVRVQQQQRQQAASMFQSKRRTPAKSRVNQLAAVLGVTAVMVAGVLWYLWQLPSGSSVGVNPAIANYNRENRGFLGEEPQAVATETVDAAPAAPTAEPSEEAPVEPAPLIAEPAEAEALVANETLPGVADPNAVPAVSETSPAPSALPAVPPTVLVSDPTVTNAIAASTTASPQAAPLLLEISRSTVSRSVSPTLQAAYDSLLQGQLDRANDLYQELLSEQPNNRDALLGLASVQLQLSNATAARNTYGKLLKLNPQDPLARTGLLQTIPQQDPLRYEQELLAMRRDYPELAPLQYALGNHYASLARWSEAQTAYFDALFLARRDTTAPVSPDYAFNLAVSLEQLGQRSAALEYYKQAATLAQAVQPGFDPAVLRARLASLEQPQP